MSVSSFVTNDFAERCAINGIRLGPAPQPKSPAQATKMPAPVRFVFPAGHQGSQGAPAAEKPAWAQDETTRSIVVGEVDSPCRDRMQKRREQRELCEQQQRLREEREERERERLRVQSSSGSYGFVPLVDVGQEQNVERVTYYGGTGPRKDVANYPSLLD